MIEINTLTEYNLWANRRVANWLLGNDVHKLDKLCASSFPTIGLTIKHILDIQIFYLSILQQMPSMNNGRMSSVLAIQELIEQSKEFNDYSSSLGMEELHETRTALSVTLRQSSIIHHCMNHSTFHRGQIITMGHQLALTKAPSIDLVFFLMERR